MIGTQHHETATSSIVSEDCSARPSRLHLWVNINMSALTTSLLAHLLAHLCYSAYLCGCTGRVASVVSPVRFTQVSQVCYVCMNWSLLVFDCLFVCLCESYIPATFKGISGRVLTCEIVHTHVGFIVFPLP